MGAALLGSVLAILYCAPPGAVTAEAFRQSLRYGWRGVLGIEIGSVIGDTVYGLVAMAGVSALLRFRWMHLAMGLVGAFLLFYLAYAAFRQSRVSFVPQGMATPRSFWEAFGVGALMSLANPMGIAFWVSFGSTVIAGYLHHPTVTDIWIFFSGFVAGCLLYGIGMTVLLTYLRRFVTPRVFQTVSIACGIALAGFGTYMGLTLI
ncbi:MAG: LysE family transporter [Thermaerobacter sp.]|nr:LysE family transporter [Thermaerobacter sp.]